MVVATLSSMPPQVVWSAAVVDVHSYLKGVITINTTHPATQAHTLTILQIIQFSELFIPTGA